MKKHSKILIVLLSLCVCFIAVGLAASATTEAPFTVNGAAFGDENTTLQEAITAADGGRVVINSDVSVSASITVQKSTVVDLGGHTLTQEFDGTLFEVADVSFSIVGEGEMRNVRTVVHADSENANVSVEAYGGGISIYNKGYTEMDTQARYTFFNITKADTLSFSGDINIYPTDDSTYIIFAPTTKNINFLGANVIVSAPHNSAWNKAGAGNSFLRYGAGVKMTIKHSTLSINHGSLLWLDGGYTGTFNGVDISSTLDANYKFNDTIKNVKLPDAQAWIDAYDSTLISVDGGYNGNSYGASDSASGYILKVQATAVHANFDKCSFYSSGRGFEGSASYRPQTKKTFIGNQLVFTDCTYNFDSSHFVWSPVYFIDALNVKWINGHINTSWGSTAFSQNSYEYAEVDGGFIGVLIDGLTSTAAIGASTIAGTWVNYYTAPQKIENYVTLDESLNLKTYKYAYVSDELYAKVISSTSTLNVADANFVNNAGTATGTRKFSSSMGYSTKTGMVSEISTSNNTKNGYFRFQVTTATANVSSDYVDVMIGAEGSASDSGSNGAAVPYKNYGFIIHEFDLSTETSYPGKLMFGLGARSWTVSYDATTGASKKESLNYSTHGSYTAATIQGGSVSFGNITVQNAISTEAGVWNRFTYVYEIKRNPIPVKRIVAGAATEDTADDVYRDFYDYTGSLLHLYVNGQHIASTTLIGTTATFIDAAFESGLCSRGVRVTYSGSTNGQTYCIDNNAVVARLGDPGIYSNGSVVKSIIGDDDFYILPENNNNYWENRFLGPLASVNGENVYSESELLSKLDDYSTVEFNRECSGTFYADKSLKIVTNGKCSLDFVSATHAIRGNGNGVINVYPAKEDEIFTVKYFDELLGINDTSTKATVGSTISVPDALDPKNQLGGKLGEDNKVYQLSGWTLDPDASFETLIVLSGKDGIVTVYPIHSSADPATVIWKSGNKTIKTDYYVPGSGVYAIGADVEGERVELGNGWYDTVVVGWDNDPSATELTEAKEYVFNACFGKGAPKEFSIENFKLNLTLYTSYELNVFVPLTGLPEDIAKDSIRIVRLSGADNEQAVGSLGECTVYSEPYIKFGGDPYGVADSSINTYRIYYTVEGTELYQEFEYGVPYYASAVMQQSESSEAKTLVMNMVNYASKVIAGLSVDKTDDEGAQVFEGLLAVPEYRNLVRTYDDDLFLENGDIWKTDIKDLTYDDVVADDPATEENEAQKSAGHWIESAGFFFSTDQPLFYIKFSENAENSTNGIKKPYAAGGNYAYWSYGMFAYIGMKGEATRPGKLFARYDGTNIDAYSDWNNKNKDISYYLVGVKTDTQNNYYIYNIAETLNINISNNNNTSASPVFYEGNGVSATYSLAAYIGEMITMADNETLSPEARAEYRTAADMAKALYAYAKVAREYKY